MSLLIRKMNIFSLRRLSRNVYKEFACKYSTSTLVKKPRVTFNNDEFDEYHDEYIQKPYNSRMDKDDQSNEKSKSRFGKIFYQLVKKTIQTDGTY